MSLQYDALVAGNCFGAIDATTALPPPTPASEPVTRSIDPNTIFDLAKTVGYALPELYQSARHFIKNKQKNEGIAIRYDDNLRLVALSKQAHLGPWKPSYTENVGFLDVIGNNRKQAWIALGNMPKETAMEEYVKLVFTLNPTFPEYLQDQYRSREQNDSRQTLNEHLVTVDNLHNQAIQESLEPPLNAVNMEQHNQQQSTEIPLPHPLPPQPPLILPPSIPITSISEMPPLGPAPAQLPPLIHPPPLNLPTTVLNGPVPNPPEAAVPVPEATVPIQGQFETLSLNTPLESVPSPPPPVGDYPIQPTIPMVDGMNAALPTYSTDAVPPPPVPVAGEATDGSIALPTEAADATKTGDVINIAQANMWTRKDMKEFKEQIRKEKDAVIKVGSGETVTVRVPTHEDGRCIFWEFSTDYYDIGFGVYFEWSKAQSNTVTVHVSDSSEEEEEGDDPNNPEKKDIEKGVGSTNKPPKPRQDEIVPICRRDCHEEVYAGSHTYPGEGVYLLKFDNSYSLWRSKTLYYRVYYSK